MVKENIYKIFNVQKQIKLVIKISHIFQKNKLRLINKRKFLD